MSKKSNRFSPEVRERAVRMVLEHRGEYPSLWATIESIAPKIGCVPQTLNDWVRQHEVDAGVRDGISSDERARIKELEREVKELRKANEILKLASAFFAQAELDRRLKCQYRLNFPHFGRLNFPHPWFAGDQPGWDACTSLGGRPGRRLAAGGSVGSNTEARLRMFSGISAACSRNRYELPSMGMTTA